MMKLKLPSSVSSSQDLVTLTREVQDYARWFEHEEIKKRLDAKHQSEPPDLSPAVNDMLHELKSSKSLDGKSLDELINMLKDYSVKSPSLTITLAAPPTKLIKALLVDWCRENIAPNVLITFKFNSTILGGMVINCGSRIFDWSFRRQILATSDKFPEVLRRV